MNTATWYFWKWAANSVDGQPRSVWEALSKGKSHPATQPFDPTALIEKLEYAKNTLGTERSKWRWKISQDPITGLAHHVRLQLPQQQWYYPEYQTWIDLFLPLGLFGWNFPWAESFPGTLPKKNVWTAENMNESLTTYEVTPEQVAGLLKKVGYAGIVLLMNHRNDYVNVAKAYGRFTVEWRHYPNIQNDPTRFSHWRASYPNDPAQTATGKTVQRKFLPAFMEKVRHGWDGDSVTQQTGDREYELLTPADAAFIMRAFIRGKKRPKHFHWMSITRQLKRSSPE